MAAPPKLRHATLAEAQEEAERRAASEPGRVFEILKCVAISQTSKASTFWMDGEESPETPRYTKLKQGDSYIKGDQWQADGNWIDAVHYGRVSGNLPARRPVT